MVGVCLHKGLKMIDADIDFCSQQIEAQEEKVQAINAAINRARKDHKEATQAVKEAQSEMNRIGQMICKLENKFGQEKRILKNMVEHRRELKELKKMLKNQHATVN